MSQGGDSDSVVVDVLGSAVELEREDGVSTKRRWKIWKCTGGPPNAVKPRSHVRVRTSRTRRRSFVVYCEGDADEEEEDVKGREGMGLSRRKWRNWVNGIVRRFCCSIRFRF